MKAHDILMGEWISLPYIWKKSKKGLMFHKREYLVPSNPRAYNAKKIEIKLWTEDGKRVENIEKIENTNKSLLYLFDFSDMNVECSWVKNYFRVFQGENFCSKNIRFTGIPIRFLPCQGKTKDEITKYFSEYLVDEHTIPPFIISDLIKRTKPNAEKISDVLHDYPVTIGDIEDISFEKLIGYTASLETSIQRIANIEEKGKDLTALEIKKIREGVEADFKNENEFQYEKHRKELKGKVERELDKVEKNKAIMEYDKLVIQEKKRQKLSQAEVKRVEELSQTENVKRYHTLLEQLDELTNTAKSIPEKHMIRGLKKIYAREVSAFIDEVYFVEEDIEEDFGDWLEEDIDEDDPSFEEGSDEDTSYEGSDGFSDEDEEDDEDFEIEESDEDSEFLDEDEY